MAPPDHFLAAHSWISYAGGPQQKSMHVQETTSWSHPLPEEMAGQKWDESDPSRDTSYEPPEKRG